jgi:RNA polymerase sigma factor (sigma-70 family)
MSVGKVYALCLRLMPDPPLAEKLTIETYLTSWRNIPFFREDTLFSSWLTGITTYTILEWIRKNGVTWNNLDLKKNKQIKTVTDRNQSGHFEIDVESLPDKERFVFVLHDIEKYTDEEVADLLSLSKNDVNNILLEAYEQLIPSKETTGRKAYIENCINFLPPIIQPGNDIWKTISSTLRREQASNSGATYEYTKEIEPVKEEKKKMFGFLNWKKK